jgi:uncharacterized protein YukE
MDRSLQMIREDLQRLSQINKVLFESWDDKYAESYNNSCIKVVEQQMKQFFETVEPLCKQIKKIEQEMQEYVHASKKR